MNIQMKMCLSSPMNILNQYEKNKRDDEKSYVARTCANGWIILTIKSSKSDT